MVVAPAALHREAVVPTNFPSPASPCRWQRSLRVEGCAERLQCSSPVGGQTPRPRRRQQAGLGATLLFSDIGNNSVGSAANRRWHQQRLIWAAGSPNTGKLTGPLWDPIFPLMMVFTQIVNSRDTL